MSDHTKKPLPEDVQYAVDNFRPGIYRHPKSGGLYTALGLVIHHHTRLPMVKYVSLTTGEENVRPLVGWPEDPVGWTDIIEHEGERVFRFTYVGERAQS